MPGMWICCGTPKELTKTHATMVKKAAATTSWVNREPSEGEERSGIFGRVGRLSRCDAAGCSHSQVGGGGYVESRAFDAFMLMSPVRNIVESVEGGPSRREKPCHVFIKMIAKHLTIMQDGSRQRRQLGAGSPARGLR